MTWTKLGDEFADDTIDLTDAAFRCHVEALVWSNKKLANLVIPKNLLKRITAVADPFAAAEELVSTGWWQDCGQTYYAGCRFSDWQIERSVIEDRREQHAARMRRHRLHKAGDHSLCTETCSVTRHGTHHKDRHVTRSSGSGRDGSVRETPSSKTGLDKEVEAVGGNGRVSLSSSLVCDLCGAAGETDLDAHGWRVCVGACAQDTL